MAEEAGSERIRVSLERAKELYDEGEVTALDVVDTVSYEHFSYEVEGAVRINPEDVPEQYEQLDKDRTVLTY